MAAIHEAFTAGVRTQRASQSKEGPPSSGGAADTAAHPSATTSSSSASGERFTLGAPLVEAVYPTFFVISWTQPTKLLPAKEKKNGSGGGGATSPRVSSNSGAAGLAASSSQLALPPNAKWRYLVEWRAASSLQVQCVESVYTHCVVPTSFSSELVVVRLSAKLGTPTHTDLASVVGEKFTVGAGRLSAMPWLAWPAASDRAADSDDAAAAAAAPTDHRDASDGVGTNERCLRGSDDDDDDVNSGAAPAAAAAPPPVVASPLPQLLRTPGKLRFDDAHGSAAASSAPSSPLSSPPAASRRPISEEAQLRAATTASPRFLQGVREAPSAPVIFDAFAISSAATPTTCAQQLAAVLRNAAKSRLASEDGAQVTPSVAVAGEGMLRTTRFALIRAEYAGLAHPLPTSAVIFMVPLSDERGGRARSGGGGGNGGDPLSLSQLWQQLERKEGRGRDPYLVFCGASAAGEVASMAAHRLIATALAADSSAAEVAHGAASWTERAERIFCVTFDAPRCEFVSSGLVLNGTAKFSGQFLHVFASSMATPSVGSALGLATGGGSEGGSGSGPITGGGGGGGSPRRAQQSVGSLSSSSSQQPQQHALPGGGFHVASPLRRPPMQRDAQTTPPLLPITNVPQFFSESSNAAFTSTVLGAKAIAVVRHPKRFVQYCVWPSLADESATDDSLGTLRSRVNSDPLQLRKTPEWEAFQLETCAAAHNLTLAEAAAMLAPVIEGAPTAHIVDGSVIEVEIPGHNLQTTETCVATLLPSGKMLALRLVGATATRLRCAVSIAHFVLSAHITRVALDLVVSTSFGCTWCSGLEVPVSESFQRYLSAPGKWISRTPHAFLTGALKLEPMCSATQRSMLAPFVTTKLLIALEEMALSLAAVNAKNNAGLFARLRSVGGSGSGSGSGSSAGSLLPKERIASVLTAFTMFFPDQSRVQWLSKELGQWAGKIFAELPWMSEALHEGRVRSFVTALTSGAVPATTLDPLPLPLCELLLYTDVVRRLRTAAQQGGSAAAGGSASGREGTDASGGGMSLCAASAVHEPITNLTTLEGFRVEFRRFFTRHRALVAARAKRGNTSQQQQQQRFGSGTLRGDSSSGIELNLSAVDQGEVAEDVAALWSCCIIHSLRSVFLFTKMVLVVGAGSGCTTVANLLKQCAHTASFDQPSISSSLHRHDGVGDGRLPAPAEHDEGRADHVVVRETQSVDLALHLLSVPCRLTVVFVVELADLKSASRTVFSAAVDAVKAQPLQSDRPLRFADGGGSDPISSPTTAVQQRRRAGPVDSSWMESRALFVVNKLDEVIQAEAGADPAAAAATAAEGEKALMAFGKSAVYAAAGDDLTQRGLVLPVAVQPRDAVLTPLVSGDAVKVAALRGKMEAEALGVLRAIALHD